MAIKERWLTKTYRFRIKDKNTAKYLNRHAEAVNFVWNYCNNIQKQAIRWGRRWPSAFELCSLTSGSSKDLKSTSRTVQSICKQYTQSRDQHRKRNLRYRGKRNLGWIPLQSGGFQTKSEGFIYKKRLYKVWKSREIPENARILDGSSFSQDSKRNWYINIVVELPISSLSRPDKEIGIDLGLKDFLACSDGFKVEAPQIYRKSEEKLAKAQRARKKKQVRNIHRKIANQRKDFHHKLSTKLVKESSFIAVGNVNSSALAKTNLAKSTYDVGWYSFRSMLKYKAIMQERIIVNVNEAYSSQDCSVCNNRTGPKGLGDLGIREWTCSNCNTLHDRDVNAAKNILRLGHQTLAEGVLV